MQLPAHRLGFGGTRGAQQNQLAVAQLGKQDALHKATAKSGVGERLILALAQQHIAADRAVKAPHKMTALRQKSDTYAVCAAKFQQRCGHRHLAEADNGVDGQGGHGQFFRAADLHADVLVAAEQIAFGGQNVQGVQQLFHGAGSPSISPTASRRSRVQ